MRSRCLACTAEAMIVSWLLTGIGFCLLVRGPGVVSAWLIWGTFVYLAAWTLVALPIALLGDRILRWPILLFGLLCGVTPLLPLALLRFTTLNQLSVDELQWAAILFSIAAVTGLLYRHQLRRAVAH